MIKKILFYALSMFLFMTGAAQTGDQIRNEIQVKGDWTDFQTAPCGENGVVSYHREDADHGKERWKFTLFNQELEAKWTSSFLTEYDVNAVDHIYDQKENKLYVMLGEQLPLENSSEVYLKSGDNRMVLAEVDLEKTRNNIVTKNYMPDYEIKLTFKTLKLAGDYIYLMGDASGNKGFSCSGCTNFLKADDGKLYNIYAFSIKQDQKFKAVPIKGDMPKLFIQNAIKTDNGNLKVLTNVVDYKDSDYNEFVLYTIDPEKAKITGRPVHLTKAVKKDVFSGAIMNHKEGRLVFTALAGKKKGEVGIVTGFVKDDEVENLIFNSTMTLMGEEFRQGGLVLSFSMKDYLFMAFHPRVYPVGDKGEFMIVMERNFPVYVPSYSYNTSTGGSIDYVHVGWEYETAYLMTFDEDGEFVETHEFDMKETDYYDIKNKPRLNIIKSEKSDADYFLVMSAGGKLITNTIDNGEMKRRERVEKIGNPYSRNSKKENSASTTEYWYDNFFLASGYISVKKGGLFSGKDKKYYFNKIEFDIR